MTACTLPLYVIRECGQCPASEEIPMAYHNGKTKTHRCRRSAGHDVRRSLMKHVDPIAAPPEWCPLRKTPEEMRELYANLC